jgi:hypothetical protein
MTSALYLLLEEKLHLQSCGYLPNLSILECNAIAYQHIACTTQCKQLTCDRLQEASRVPKAIIVASVTQKGQFMINNNASKFEMDVQKTREIIRCRK